MLEILQNEDFGMVRLLEADDRILFCAADVARALGYTNARAAVAQHCRGVVKCDIPHPQSKSKTIKMAFITEGDLYRLIIRSKLPAAKKFETWLFDEVLPSIRKNQLFAIDDMLENHDRLIAALKALKKERENKRNKEKQLNCGDE